MIYLSFLKNMCKAVWRYIPRRGKISILMDNARFHKAAIIKDYMVDKADYNLIYMPAYSPELNFIENVFNRIKQRYHKLAPTNSK